MTAVSKKAGISTCLQALLDRSGPGPTVLVIRLGAMGDILRTLPAVRKLRRAVPGATIHWACDDRWAQVLQDHPDLDGLLPLPRRRLDENRPSPSGWLRSAGLVREYRRQLRTVGFDLVLDFHGNFRSGVVGVFSGANIRIGYDGHQQKEGNRLFTTLRVPPGQRRCSRMSRNLSLLAPLGIEQEPIPDGGLPRNPELDAEAGELVRAALGPVDRYAVINPGVSVGQNYKKPPPDLLAAAAKRLRESAIGVLVTYGPGEIRDAEQVVALSGGAGTVAPPTSLPLLFHLIRNSLIFIGGDTGPLHIACAVGTPVLGIYGPTDPSVNTPWNVPHETVFPSGRTYTGIKKIDREAGGFHGLTGTMVVERLERLLAVLNP